MTTEDQSKQTAPPEDAQSSVLEDRQVGGRNAEQFAENPDASAERTETESRTGVMTERELAVLTDRVEREQREFGDITALLERLRPQRNLASEDEAQPTDVAAVPLETQTSEPSAVMLDHELTALQKTAVDYAETFQRRLAMAKTRVAELATLDFASPDAAQQAFNVLQSCEWALQSAEQTRRSFNQLRAQVKMTHAHYTQAALAEAGFADQVALGAGLGATEDQAYDLRHRLLGGLRFRQQLKNLQQRQAALEQLQKRTSAPPVLPGDENFYASRERDVYEATADVRRQALDTLQDRLRRHLESITPKEQQPEALTAAEIRSLNDDYIAHNVTPRIEERLRDEQHWVEDPQFFYRKEQFEQAIAALSDPQARERLRELLHKVFAFSGRLDWYHAQQDEEREQAEALQQEIQALPEDLRQYIPGWEANTNERYQAMATFIRTVPELSRHAVVRTAVGNIVSLADPYRFGRQSGQSHPAWLGSKKLDTQRWQVMMQNPAIQQRYGKPLLEQANRLLERSIVQKLLTTQEHTDESNDLGWKALALRTTEVTPHLILNAYREPGHSGERPFLSVHEWSRNSQLYKMISSLTEQQLAELENQKIPGLTELIATVKQYPDTFNDPYLRDAKGMLDWDARNPQYAEIQQQLAQMATHYLRHGSTAEQFFVMGLIEDLETDLSEIYPELERLLLQPDSMGLHGQIVHALKIRCQRHREDAGAVELLFGSKAASEADFLGKRTACETFYALLGRDAIGDNVLAGIAKNMRRSVEEVRSVYAFYRELAALNIRREQSSQNEEKAIENFLLLSRNDQALPFLRELIPFNYAFDSEHAEALLAAIPQREQIIKNLQEITLAFPNFSFRPTHTYQYNQESRASYRVYDMDPYQSVFGQMDTERYFSGLYDVEQRSEGENSSFYQGCMRTLRKHDRMLEREGKQNAAIAPERFAIFEQSIRKLVHALYSPNGTLRRYRDFF